MNDTPLQDKKSTPLVLIVVYALMAAWILGAGIYLVREMLKQHAISSDLSAVRTGSTGWEQASSSLITRGNTGLLYVLQELQQNPGSNTAYRAASGLQKIAGSARAPLTENEKAAVRKLLIDANQKVTDCLEGRKVVFSGREIGFIRQFLTIVEQARFTRLDKQPALTILRKLLERTEPGTPEELAYIRENVEALTDRFDRCVTGETMELTPPEKALFTDVANYCRDLGNATPETAPPVAPVAPAAPETAAAPAQAQPTVKEESLNDIRLATVGLAKMSGMFRARLTGGEIASIQNDPELQGSPFAATLATCIAANELEVPENPVKALEALAAKPKPTVDVSDAEAREILQAARVSLDKYEAERGRLSGLIVSFIQHLKAASRFIDYPEAADAQSRATAGPIAVISALWKKTDERVMMLDMVNILGTTNGSVRADIEKAFVLIAQPAVPNLVRAIQRDKIDEALAAKTRFRTKMERLRELNEMNKIVRISCMRALGQIGGPEAKRVLTPLADDKDPDIAAAARQAGTVIRQR